MARPKGDGRGRLGGRQKGTPNKATALSQQALSLLIGDYYDSGQFKADFAELQPRERIDVMIKLLGYVMPKPQAIAVDINAAKNSTIEDTLAELAEEY